MFTTTACITQSVYSGCRFKLKSEDNKWLRRMATLYKVEDDNLNVIHPQIIENVAPENGNHFSLQELHKMIGGYIEIVQLGEGNIAVVDESGILKSRMYNFLASSKTYRALYGNVLVCKSNQIR